MKLSLVFFISFVFLFLTIPAHAQEFVGTSDAYLTLATPSSQVQYDLPYPGLLPDHPLYILKVLRDRVVGFLINDPLKRAEFNLLNSDKRIRAGKMLLDKNEDDLAMETISKSNNYFDNTIVSYQKAKKSNKDTASLKERMKLAMKKHIQVLKENKNKVDKKFIRQYNTELSRMEKYLKTAQNLK